jgi:YVTN family beta-propeller protein
VSASRNPERRGPRRRRLPVMGSIIALAACGQPVWIATAPADTAYTTVGDGSATVLPNGRVLTPRGRQIEVAPHPYGLVLSRDGRVAVTANSGVRPFSISILRDITAEHPVVQQVPPGATGDDGVLESVFMGLALSPDGGLLYAGGGQEGAVVVFDAVSGERVGQIDCNVRVGGRKYEDSYIGDLVLSRDGNTIYAVDQTNFRLVIASTTPRVVETSVPVGRYPFGITLTPDEQRVYVANVGQYQYSPVEPLPGTAEPRGLSFPAFSSGTREAVEGLEAEGYRVPGLGDANAPEAFSVWGVDVHDPAAARVVSRIKTGILVGEPIEGVPAVGGSSPNSVVSTADRVFVSNGNNDRISVIEIARDTVVADIVLRLDDRLGPLRGVIPFGLALSPDATRLYVAEAGVNAVGVIDVATLRVLGHIPVGWFPGKLAVTPDGRSLVVANAKGRGSGPNGGPQFVPGPAGSYIGNLMRGTVSVLTIPPDSALAGETAQVIRNNFRFRRSNDSALRRRRDNPIPLYPGEFPSPIHHLVFITKENRTFDEVLGQVAGARGEPSLARFGRDVTVRNRDGSASVPGVTVMPNHLALAARFAIADNFYCDSDVSADGHRWLAGTFPNEWVEAGTPAAYGGGRQLRWPTTAPGMPAFVGSSAAIYPEDYNEAGSIWDHFDRHAIGYFNFGLGFEFAGGIEDASFRYTGIRIPFNYPMPGSLLEHTSRNFATFNTGVPDQFRVDMFIREFTERWLGEGKTMPAVITMMLPNDHGAGERPAAGYPFLESYMADNDLALGRVVEFLSHTPYWKDMAIIVTEDDPQGGADHIDAHRSILMVISPFARNGYVGKNHYSFGSIMKTFWNVLGIPCLNQYDFGATDLADLFTRTPDSTPYTVLPVDSRIFDPRLALDPSDPGFDWKALAASPRMDDVDDMQRMAAEKDERR